MNNKEENNPLVSIIMGAYNCENTIDESIQSIINQSYENWKLIVCDDSSTDGTGKILKKYASEYKEKIIIIRNSENKGLANSLNNCLKYIDGDYIARQDADDISLQNRLEIQVDFLENNKQYDLVGTAMIAFNEENKETSIRKAAEEIPNPNKLALGPPFCHATILTRSDVYKSLNGYRVNKYTRRCEDIDLWFRFFKKRYKGINIDEPLYKVRDNNNSYKRRNIKSYIYATKVCFDGYRLIKAPIKSYFYLTKPLIGAMTPSILKKIYHAKKYKTVKEDK